MPTRALVLALATAGCASAVGQDGDGGARPPPHVFLSLDRADVIGDQVAGTVNVTGCDAVAHARLLLRGAALAEVAFDGGPTRFSLGTERFAGLWPQLGLAAQLALSAEAVCGDGRSNTSPPVSATFFPVASRVSLAGDGGQVVPDAFLAQGGVAGRAVGFLGCVGTARGATALAVTDAQGVVTAQNDQLPFPCGAATQLSDRAGPGGVRWVLEPGQGAYAVDGALRVLKTLVHTVRRMGVSTATGTAIFWDEDLSSPRLWKLEPLASAAGDWTVAWPGTMNADPVVDVARGSVWVSGWQAVMGSGHADVVVSRLELATGALLNLASDGNGPPIVIRQFFGVDQQPPAPAGAFSADGRVLYLALTATDAAGHVRTTVQACATASLVGGCLDPDLRWTSTSFDGALSLLVPFAGGTLVAAVGPFQTWFLSAADGSTQNLGGRPIAPTGSLQVLGAQPGQGTDFFLLHGPVGASGAGFPTEAVAVDAPAGGELYRFGFGSGASPAAGLTLGVDEAGQAWFRVGQDLVKPLPLATYRGMRGLTP